ncbi:MAG: hypothetical protein H7Y86_00845 [Rhizobacter sp.]|nr:hypothetical protein [Ferruginibacter sp.]
MRNISPLLVFHISYKPVLQPAHAAGGVVTTGHSLRPDKSVNHKDGNFQLQMNNLFAAVVSGSSRPTPQRAQAVAGGSDGLVTIGTPTPADDR